MITLKTRSDIKKLRTGGKRLAFILQALAEVALPGVTTKALDDYARKLISEGGDEAAFLNYRPSGARYPYPAALCVSLNEEIVHGIPGERVLKSGDLVSLDLGLKHDGLFTDAAITVPVGEITPAAKKLLTITQEALLAGIQAIKLGAYIGDIGSAIEKKARPEGFGIVTDLGGHGVGYAVHEEPMIPNQGRPKSGLKLKAGLVLAIEPMFTLGAGQVKLQPDGYTYVTADGSLAAHFEHTVYINNRGEGEVLTK